MIDYKNIKELVDNNHSKHFFSGDFFKVYNARLNNEEVIIKTNKLSKKEYCLDKLLEHEYNLISNLNHPNIVQPIGFGMHEDAAYLIQKNHGYYNLYQRRIYLSLHEILKITKEMTEALILLDSKKIIHGDIKPDNIITNKKATLIDFGLARKDEGKKNEELVNFRGTKGYVEGTPGYFSPDKFITNRVHTSKEDTFSLGVVLMNCIGYWRGVFDHKNCSYNPIMTYYDNKEKHKLKVKDTLLNYEFLRMDSNKKITHDIVDLIGDMTCNEQERISIQNVLYRVNYLRNQIKIMK